LAVAMARTVQRACLSFTERPVIPLVADTHPVVTVAVEATVRTMALVKPVQHSTPFLLVLAVVALPAVLAVAVHRRVIVRVVRLGRVAADATSIALEHRITVLVLAEGAVE
jgi:HAMP domain-containing protein